MYSVGVWCRIGRYAGATADGVDDNGIAPRDPAFYVRGRQVDDRASARQDFASGQIILRLVPAHALFVRRSS